MPTYDEKKAIKESMDLDFGRYQSNKLKSMKIRYGVGRFYE